MVGHVGSVVVSSELTLANQGSDNIGIHFSFAHFDSGRWCLTLFKFLVTRVDMRRCQHMQLVNVLGTKEN